VALGCNVLSNLNPLAGLAFLHIAGAEARQDPCRLGRSGGAGFVESKIEGASAVGRLGLVCTSVYAAQGLEGAALVRGATS